MSDPSVKSETDLESLVGRIANEFQERLQRGEPVEVDEYVRMHPQIGDVLRDVLPMVRAAGGDCALHPPRAVDESGMPSVLGDYRILRQIGRGGMGIVYEAVQESLGRHVALKVLPFRTGMDPSLLQRFERETKAAARLHHSHIVPVFGVGEHEGIHFYAMQFIDGRTLDVVLDEVRRLHTGSTSDAKPPGVGASTITSRIARGLLSDQFDVTTNEEAAAASNGTVSSPASDCPDTHVGEMTPEVGISGHRYPPKSHPGLSYIRSVARLGFQVADALAYAHSHGVLHRDIKPSNLILDMAGSVWVADFGLAKAEGTPDLTQSGDVMGTLRYLAPERLRGRGDAHADVYSLGVTLYELLTLRPAFDASDHPQLVRQITTEEPPPPRRLNPNVPRDLETIIVKASAKEPATRYSSAAALADDLNCFLADRPITARRMGVLERLGRWARRNPAVATASGLSVLLFFTGFSLVWWQWGRAEFHLEQATTSAAEAGEERDRTYAALDAMTNQVASDWLATQRELTPEQKQFLQNAVRYYRDFANFTATDDAGRARVAEAAQRLGSLLERLGEQAEAEAAYRQALNLFADLSREKPGEPRYRHGLAQSSHALSAHLRKRQEVNEAEKLARAALTLLQVLHQEDPQDPKFRAELASAQSELGNFLGDLGRLEEAEQAQQESIRIRERLVAESQATPEYRVDLARNHINLGVVLLRRRRLDDAERSFRQSLKIYEELVADHTQVGKYREDLALGYNNLGVLLDQLDRTADAEPLFRRGLPHHRQLVDAFPSVPNYRKLLAWNLQNVGIALEVMEQWPEAEAMHKEGIGVLERLCTDYPETTDYAVVRSQSYRSFGRLLRKLGRHDDALLEFTKAIGPLEALLTKANTAANVREGLYNVYFDRATALGEMDKFSDALREWDRAIELSPDHYRDAARLARGTVQVRAGDPAPALALAEELTAPEAASRSTLYNGAEVFSLASASVKDNTAMSEVYAQKAVDLLKRAIGKGYLNWRKLETNPPFAPLRSRGDFQQLISDLAAAKAKENKNK